MLLTNLYDTTKIFMEKYHFELNQLNVKIEDISLPYSVLLNSSIKNYWIHTFFSIKMSTILPCRPNICIIMTDQSFALFEPPIAMNPNGRFHLHL